MRYEKLPKRIKQEEVKRQSVASGYELIQIYRKHDKLKTEICYNIVKTDL